MCIYCDEPNSWKGVRLSKRSTTRGTMKKAKGLHSVSVVPGKKVTLSLVSDEGGKDRTLGVSKLPELGQQRLYVDSFVLDFQNHADALACVRKCSLSFEVPRRSRPCPALSAPKTTRPP